MPTTMQDLVAEARQEIEEVDAGTAKKRLDEGAVALDVREADEIERGCIPRAVHIPRGILEYTCVQHPATQDPATPIVVYCGAGGRAALAARTLRTLGYRNVASIAGGFGAWVGAGHEVQLPSADGGGEDDE